MSLIAAGRYPRYRAPTGDGQTLCVPPWNEAETLVEKNRAAIQSHGHQLWGHSLGELAREARAAVLSAASKYTRSYADVQIPANPNLPFVLTGHQPAFAHPGVWLKNFAAAQLAEQVAGVAISLVIDTDLCRSTSILVPAGSTSQPRAEHVPFDAGMPQTPWEQRPLADREMWQSFGRRAAETIAPLVPNALVGEWWPKVLAEGIEQVNLAAALSQARHRLELDWQSTSLEIPQSLLCQTDAFRQFVVWMLTDAQRFRTVHNAVLADYRREHRLRNHAQPVPDLTESEGWTEAPFWLWSTAGPERRAVFVQRQGGELRVSDRAGFEGSLSCSDTGGTSDAVEQLANWESRGIKLRTRALVTTMFARLFLADLFIHGIGGAKYDQVTDEICQRLFGFRTPAHLTLTGTLRLPISHVVDPPERERQVRQSLRNLWFHPEKSVVGPSPNINNGRRVEELIVQKQKWVQTVKTRENAAERHRQIVAANEALAAWTGPERDKLERELNELGERRQAIQILDSREYAYCLFPRDLLRTFLLDFPARMP